MGSGIWDRRIDETPIAIIDCETTGLYAGADRIVELSVVRVDPGGKPTLVFDTLVNPRRAMAATEIHGIADTDVKDAPTFNEIAQDILGTVRGTVVAAYNVYFDMSFLQYELRQCDLAKAMPYFCLMYMRPMLGLGRKCSLSDACLEHQVTHAHAHAAGSDALASGELWTVYTRSMREHHINTFRELASLKSYKFVESFDESPIVHGSQGVCRCNRMKPRTGIASTKTTATTIAAPQSAQSTVINPLAEYWDTLAAVLSDLKIDEAELEQVRQKRITLGLTIDQIRSVHAKVYANVIGQVTADKLIDDRDCRTLKRLYECLRILGWVPGM